MNAYTTKATLTLAIALSSLLFGYQQRQRRVEPPESSGTVVLDGTRAELPMDLDTRRPMIEMTVNGEGPYWFVVDTGAGSSVIDKALADDLGLTAIGTLTVRSPNGPPIESPQYRVETLQSGGLRVEDAGVVGIDLASMTNGLFQGVLGIGAFRDHLLTFDYAGSRLVIESGSLQPGSSGTVALKRSGPVIGFDIEVAGVTVPAHLDTGSPGGIMLPKAMEDRWTFASPPVDGPPARLVGAEHPTWRAQLDGTVTVAGITFADPQVGLAEFISDYANLGYEIVRDNALTIDQRNGLLRLARGASAGTSGGRSGPQRAIVRADTEGPRLGIAFAMAPGALQIADGGIAVRLVEVGGGAAAAGILVGDVLTTINDEAVTEMDASRFTELMRSVRPLRLVLVRDGEAYETTIE